MTGVPCAQQVAVFDTAFHQTMPPAAYMYALPHEYYTKYHVRKYGFHGTSVKYLVSQVGAKLQTCKGLCTGIREGRRLTNSGACLISGRCIMDLVWQLCCIFSPIVPHLWPMSPRAVPWAVLWCEHAATCERRLPGCWARRRAR